MTELFQHLPPLRASVPARFARRSLPRVCVCVLAYVFTPAAPTQADFRDLLKGAQPAVPSIFLRSRRSPSSPVASIPVWTMPLMDRRLSDAERDVAMSPDFRGAISRMEAIYDPTRLDGTGLSPKMSVRAGTASMNNVFADRWTVVASDANVDIIVSHVALAWGWARGATCSAYSIRVLVLNKVVPRPLRQADCVRLVRDARSRRTMLSMIPIVAATLDVPAFAAPEPGNRLSSRDFWAAKAARIEAIREALRISRELAHPTSPSP